jgi:hypothetical protein
MAMRILFVTVGAGDFTFVYSEGLSQARGVPNLTAVYQTVLGSTEKICLMGR